MCARYKADDSHAAQGNLPVRRVSRRAAPSEPVYPDFFEDDDDEDNTPEDPMDGLDVSDLSSIKVGDTSVYIGDKYRSNQRSRTLQSHNANLDEIVMGYTKQLNQFRRIL